MFVTLRWLKLYLRHKTWRQTRRRTEEQRQTKSAGGCCVFVWWLKTAGPVLAHSLKNTQVFSLPTKFLLFFCFHGNACGKEGNAIGSKLSSTCTNENAPGSKEAAVESSVWLLDGGSSSSSTLSTHPPSHTSLFLIKHITALLFDTGSRTLR